MEMSDQLHASRGLTTGKKHLITITRKLGWSQSRSGHFEEDIHLLCPCRESIDDSTDVQTTAHSLYRPRYPGSYFCVLCTVLIMRNTVFAATECTCSGTKKYT